MIYCQDLWLETHPAFLHQTKEWKQNWKQIAVDLGTVKKWSLFA